MSKLIIFDLYGTILKSDKHDGIVRPGLYEIMDHYGESSKAIFTDGVAETVEFSLECAGLAGKFDKVYCWDHCVSEHAYSTKVEKFKKYLLQGGTGNVKNLSLACSDFSVSELDAVFIGDDYLGRDSKSAKLNGVRFIKVPQFRDAPPGWEEREDYGHYVDYEDPKNPFSLVSLIPIIECSKNV